MGITLVLPKWARNDMPVQVWTAGEFEMFAVKYREEVETFLQLCYEVRFMVQENTSSVTRRDVKRRMEAFRGTSSQVIAEVPEEIGGTTPTVVSLRQTPSGQTSREDQPLNVQSTSSTRGYVNNPAGLSTSRRLSELVGQPREEPITVMDRAWIITN